MSVALFAVLGAVITPACVVGLVFAGDRLLRKLPYRQHRRIQPWIWLTPAIVLAGSVLLYPALDTLYDSFFGPGGSHFIGWANYAWMFTSGSMLQVLKNNAIWLVVFPVITVIVALLAAILADRVRYERLAKGAVVLPTAISLTVTGVIWQFMYEYRPAGLPQIGTVDAVTSHIPGIGSQAWVQSAATSNFALIMATVWAHAGLAMIIFSAAVKAVPAELIEAARIDGARESRIILRIVVPNLWPTIAVMMTVLVIYALKIFDIVYVMTNGNFGTDVIANEVYTQLFVGQNLGRASALAVFLCLLASPVIFFNVHQLRREAI